MLEQSTVGARAAEVVGVHYGERSRDRGRGGEDGMAGSPRLGAAGRCPFERLARVRDLHPGADDLRHVAAELILDVSSNHEHDFPEAGPDGVVDAVVEQRLAAWPHPGELLEPPETGPETRREHYQGGRRACPRGQ